MTLCFSSATSASQCPCPSIDDPWPQSPGDVLAPAWVAHSHSPSQCSLPQIGLPIAAFPQGCPFPNVCHPWPQSHKCVPDPSWVALGHGPSGMSLLQRGPPTAAITWDVPTPLQAHSHPESPQRQITFGVETHLHRLFLACPRQRPPLTATSSSCLHQGAADFSDWLTFCLPVAWSLF